jgi:hypothetical protein
MTSTTDLRERFLRDSFPRRIGNLAANLARIDSFSDHPSHDVVLGHILLESKYFIEWCAPEAPLDLQVSLAELQLQLSQWERGLPGTLADNAGRNSMAAEASNWSRRLLESSGLLG